MINLSFVLLYLKLQIMTILFYYKVLLISLQTAFLNLN